MIDPARHKALLVDLDGTLYRQKPVRLLMAAELLLLGAASIRILREFRKQHESVRTGGAAGGRSPYAYQLEQTAEALGLPQEKVEQTVRHWMVLRPIKWLRLFRRRELLARLSAFRREGGRLALVSDYPASEKLVAFPEVQFEVVISNGEPGGPSQLKPDPEGYLEAASRLGITAAACLVVGDRKDADGDAAQRAGMDFFLVA